VKAYHIHIRSISHNQKLAEAKRQELAKGGQSAEPALVASNRPSEPPVATDSMEMDMLQCQLCNIKFVKEQVFLVTYLLLSSMCFLSHFSRLILLW